MPGSTFEARGRRGAWAAVMLAALVAGACGGAQPMAPTAPTAVQPISAAGDPRPPMTLACPANVAATSPGGPVPVTFAPPVASGATPVGVSCTPPSGSAFPVGATPVSCTATDATGQTASCAFTVTVTRSTPQLARAAFLAFGDSTTMGEVSFPLPSPAGATWPNFSLIVVPSASYPHQLLTLLRARYTAQGGSLSMANAGKPGERAAQAVARFNAELAAVRPEVVLILHGFNDLSALGDAGVLPAAQAIDRMAKDARGRGALVYLATLTPPRAGGRNTLPASQVTSLNGWVKEIARGEGAVLVDLHAALAADVTRFIGVDGLHPTEAGYFRMAEAFFQAIQAHLELR